MTTEGNPLAYTVVVPLYNEQESVTPLYVKIIDVMDAVGEPFEIVFVDDGSRDNTFRILSQISDDDERVMVVRLRRNFGQTAALKAGFDHSRGEIIISMDGDLQHDPAEIPLFIAKMKEGYDIVSGWRVERTDHWLTRQLPSRIANWHYGQAFPRGSARLRHHIQSLSPRNYFRNPPLRRAASLHPRPGQLGGGLHRRGAHHEYSSARTGSRITASRARFACLLDLVSVKFLLDYSTKPLQLFGLAGLACLTGGFGIGLWVFARKALLNEGLLANHGPLMILGMALVMGGIQFIAIGLIGELLARTYYESQNKPVYTVRELRGRHDEGAARIEPPRIADATGR